MSVHTSQDASSSKSPQLCRKFTISEIQLATRNFDEPLVIGRGGFGKVYKGAITDGPNLLTVAIKRLDSTSDQGASEFWAEVNMLSNLRHCHLVSLIGYCNDGKELILVYEYMSRGTLEDHLHRGQTPLSWFQRLTICIGAARGLDYLHTGTSIKHGVVHRDVKSSNILLDDSWASKISDFGLSRICPKNQLTTYVNTGVKGTFGYLDPDYFYTGKLTRKSDVYAFGVVLFEVLCGKRAVDRSIHEEQWGLAAWAQNSIKEGRLKQIVDTNIKESISPICLKDFAKLAKRCLHKHTKQRPTMAEVVVGLESVLAFQEKANSTLQPTSMNVFARKAPKALQNMILNRFDFDYIKVATDNFSAANIIPRLETLDYLYKGKLQNGQSIVVGRIYIYVSDEHIMKEASTLVKLEHDNLAKFLGYCIEGTSLFIVYDFALHATFDCLVFDPECTQLNWDKRYKIIVGVARALLYLHRDAPVQLIHCGVESGNVLLDENLNPVLLGILDKFGDINRSTCIPTTVFETWGRYKAPEYICYAKASIKADVYSLGVLLLELIAARRMPHMHPFKYVGTNWLEGTLSSIIDSRIDVDLSSMMRFIEIGLLCVQEDAVERPTMEEVVSMLLDSSSLTFPVEKMREKLQECSSGTSTPVDQDYLSESPFERFSSSTKFSDQDMSGF